MTELIVPDLYIQSENDPSIGPILNIHSNNNVKFLKGIHSR